MRINSQFFKAAGRATMALGLPAIGWAGVIASAISVAMHQDKPVEKVDSKKESPSPKK